MMANEVRLVEELRRLADLTPPICCYDRPEETEIFGKKITVYCKHFEDFQDTVRQAADRIEELESQRQKGLWVGEGGREEMTDREKLIELLCDVPADGLVTGKSGGKKYTASWFIADYLLASGVAFTKDTDVPSKWISVEERLPTEEDADDDMCVLAIHKATPRRYFNWQSVACSPFDFTHWMPLPEPPRVQGVPNGTDRV